MKIHLRFPFTVLLFACHLLLVSTVQAHCDAIDGPVVAAAVQALTRGDVTPALKWVNQSGESEIRAAFALTLAVRAKGSEARKLADQYFFETLVRVHRRGEGEPFTGLKPAGAIDPAFQLADQALREGKVEALAAKTVQAVREGVHRRFEAVRERQRHAEDSIEAGRAFVAAYVDYAHFIEAVLAMSVQPDQAHHTLHKSD